MTDADHTYVFIDESGDAGFKVGKGSSPFFCIAAVIFRSADDVAETEEAIRALRFKLGVRFSHEFHFNSEPPEFRTAFCEAICGCPFKVRAIVVDKERIWENTKLRQSPNHFYNFITRMLLQHNIGSAANIKVRIDGRMNRELKTYLRKELNRESKIIHDTKFSDSKTDSIIQLADMVAGAIARSYKLEKKNCKDLRRILKPCIQDVWEFGHK